MEHRKKEKRPNLLVDSQQSYQVSDIAVFHLVLTKVLALSDVTQERFDFVCLEVRQDQAGLLIRQRVQAANIK